MMTDNREDWDNRPRKHTITEADKQKLVERHFEAARLRQAEADLAFLQAMQLGEALQRLEAG